MPTFFNRNQAPQTLQAPSIDANYLIENIPTISIDALRQAFEHNRAITSSIKGRILSYTVQSPRDDLTLALLRSNADIEYQSKRGRVTGLTPLLLAARYGSPHTISLLLDFSAYVKARDSECNNCLHAAMQAQNPIENLKTILLQGDLPFEEFSPLLNESNKDGQLPIDLVENPRPVWELLMEYFEECKFKKVCRYGGRCKYLHFSLRK